MIYSHDENRIPTPYQPDGAYHHDPSQVS